MNTQKNNETNLTTDGLCHENYLQKARQTEKNYPYIVIRRYAAVYQNVPVMFVRDETVAPYPRSVTIVNAEAYVSGQLTEFARGTVISITMHIVKSKGLRACAVFSAQDCVFCEADGSENQSNNPPSCDINYEKLLEV